MQFRNQRVDRLRRFLRIAKQVQKPLRVPSGNPGAKISLGRKIVVHARTLHANAGSNVPEAEPVVTVLPDEFFRKIKDFFLLCLQGQRSRIILHIYQLIDRP